MCLYIQLKGYDILENISLHKLKCMKFHEFETSFSGVINPIVNVIILHQFLGTEALNIVKIYRALSPF